MKNDESKKVQVPYRLPENWVNTLRELPGVVGFSQQQIIEDAMASLFGERDAMMEGRVNMVRQAIKKKKVRNPFSPIIASCGDFPWASELAMSEETCTA